MKELIILIIFQTRFFLTTLNFKNRHETFFSLK